MSLTYSQLLADTPVVLMAENRALRDPAIMQIIVRQAEDEIMERMDHDAFRKIIQPDFVIGPSSQTLDLSGRANPVLEVRALRLVVDGIGPLIERREIERLYATFAGLAPDMPRYYAEDDAPLVFRFFPTPDTQYTVRVTVNEMPERLSTLTQQSLLTRMYPRIMEMAVYKHGARFMRNQIDEARYEKAIDSALMGVNTQLARRRRDETGMPSADTSNRVG